MIDHITLPVKDLRVSKRFYTTVLGPLGYVLFEKPDWPMGAAFCASNKRDLWIQQSNGEVKAGSFSCLAFGAPSKEAVDSFHNHALRVGGVDNGKPGYRPQYGAGYYAAFVLDPDGNNIEAIHDDLLEYERVAKLSNS